MGPRTRRFASPRSGTGSAGSRGGAPSVSRARSCRCRTPSRRLYGARRTRRESILRMTPTTMRAVVLRAAGGPEQLVLEQVATPAPGDGEALVRVHAAALTRDELEWPVDRLPAIPSYELSGVVVALGPGVDDVAVGDEVYAMTA